MNDRIITAISFFLFCSFLSAQQVDYQLDPSNSNNGFIPLDMGSGETFYVTTQRFGFDSTYLELMHCDAQQNVLNAGAYKLLYDLIFVNTAVKLNDGVLVGGGNLGFNDYAFLFKSDFQGALQWYVHLDNLPFSQDQVVQLNSTGSDFSLYTYPGGEYREGFCRFSGTSTAGPTSGVAVSMVVGTEVRIYRAVPSIGGPNLDFVVGAGYANNQFNTKSVLLAEVSPSGANWMKFVDLGAVGISEIEDVSSIAYTTGGSYLLTGVMSGATGLEGFIMQVDQFGNVQWAKRYADPNGALLLTDAYELLNGNFLIAGRNSSLGMLLTVDANGDFVDHQQYLGAGNAGLINLHGFWENDQGQLWVQGGQGRQLGLTAYGVGCDFISAPPLDTSTIITAVTTVSYSNTSLPPTTYQPASSARMSVHGWINTCGVIGVDEQDRGNDAYLFPQPTRGLVRLNGVDVPSDETVDVLDMTGRLMLQAGYNDGIDLSVLDRGNYLLRFHELNRLFRVLKQ
jgi:hypothetical protein